MGARGDERDFVVGKGVTQLGNLQYTPLYRIKVFVKNHFLVNLKATLQNYALKNLTFPSRLLKRLCTGTHFHFSESFSEKYNLHIIKFTHFKCSIQ